MNRVVKILMERDGISKDEAKEFIRDTQAEISEAIESGDFQLVYDIMRDNLMLEPDYIMDLI